MGLLDPWLDSWLYRHPFEGASALRYARRERPAFGDLDERLLDALAPELAAARRALDVGAGPGTTAAALRARHPHLDVIAVEPGRELAAALPARGALAVRARGEQLPLATAAVDVAVCVSAIRHVRDRAAALAELRRVVRPGGVALVVELDPQADRRRARAHAGALGSPVLRAAFTPLVLRTAPRAGDVAALARAAGWRVALAADPVQPVYVMRLA